MKSMCLGEDGMSHKLHISVDNVTSSTVAKCTRAVLQSAQHC